MSQAQSQTPVNPEPRWRCRNAVFYQDVKNVHEIGLRGGCCLSRACEDCGPNLQRRAIRSSLEHLTGAVYKTIISNIDRTPTTRKLRGSVWEAIPAPRGKVAILTLEPLNDRSVRVLDIEATLKLLHDQRPMDARKHTRSWRTRKNEQPRPTAPKVIRAFMEQVDRETLQMFREAGMLHRDIGGLKVRIENLNQLMYLGLTPTPEYKEMWEKYLATEQVAS